MTDKKEAKSEHAAEHVAGELLKVEGALDARGVADVVRKHIEPRTLEITDGTRTQQVLVVPDGLKTLDVKPFLDKYATAPERRKGTAVLTDLESFIAHVKARFADDDGAIFAHQGSARAPRAGVLAVFDYHRMSAEGAPRSASTVRSTGPALGRVDGLVRHEREVDDPGTFAEFLENRIADVADPLDALETTKKVVEAMRCTTASPARLIDLARGLTVRIDSVVANQQNLASGESVLRFDTSHKDESGAPLEVPGAFIICVPVFRCGAAYQLGARLRYRVKDGRVTWSYDLYRSAETFEHAFQEACSRATKETELPLYYGAPEV